MLGKFNKHTLDGNQGPSEIYGGEKPLCSVEQPGGGECSSLVADVVGRDMEITCFTEDLKDVTVHFQIIRMTKQIYVWIGCNSAKLGHMYAAATTRPNNMVGVTCLLGGRADNAGSGIARHLVLKTGLNIILACNIPKDNPILEAEAEVRLFQELRTLGYLEPKMEGASF